MGTKHPGAQRDTQFVPQGTLAAPPPFDVDLPWWREVE